MCYFIHKKCNIYFYFFNITSKNQFLFLSYHFFINSLKSMQLSKIFNKNQFKNQKSNRNIDNVCVPYNKEKRKKKGGKV